MLGVTVFRGTEKDKESFDDSGSICIKTSIFKQKRVRADGRKRCEYGYMRTQIVLKTAKNSFLNGYV